MAVSADPVDVDCFSRGKILLHPGQEQPSLNLFIGVRHMLKASCNDRTEISFLLGRKSKLAVA